MLARLLGVFCCMASLGFALPEGVVDDIGLMKSAMKGFDQKGFSSLSGKTAQQKTKSVEGKSLKLKAPQVSQGLDIKQARHSVALVVTARQCGKCPSAHLSSTATAWVASEDGILVTNYHVLVNATAEDQFGVVFEDGSVYGIVDVLASDKNRDIAVFKINAKNLKPLAIGPDAEVGSSLHLISHPEGHFYTYAEGKLARYVLGAKPKEEKKSVVWMVSTAEFALGSSGGPMMDEQGCVAGMVASTSTLYGTPRPNGMFKGGKTNLSEKDGSLVRDPQMVVRQCVAACSLRSLIYGETE